MGYLRFALAAVVVIFHTAATNAVVGRVAVTGFFVLSGFVITKALLRSYLGARRGLVRFYGNRLLRLAPAYAAVVLVTAALMEAFAHTVHGPLTLAHPFLFSGADGSADAVSKALTLRDFRPDVQVLRAQVPRIDFSPYLVPQAWSIGVEVVFYAAAPVLAVITRDRPRRAALMLLATFTLYAVAASVSSGNVDAYVYRNAVTTMAFFSLGVWAATAAPRVSLTPVWTLGLPMLVLIAVVAQGLARPDLLTGPKPVPLVVWQLAVALTVLGCCVGRRSFAGATAAWDRRLGDLSYPLYLVHGVIILALPLVSHLLLGHLEALGGRPYTARYCLTIVSLSVGAAWALHVLVERPVERLRARLRGQPTRRDASSA